jgi:hypothetical protein
MAHYDDAIPNASRHLLRMNDFVPFLESHISTAEYKLAQPQLTHAIGEKDRVYHSNNGFWEAVIYGVLKRTDLKITLDSFFIFEWLPRSPGLYYTPAARSARDQAQKHIKGFENGVLVYDPYGKESMLKGGIGNVRLKSIVLDNSPYFLMGASSDGMCNEGIPVAIPSHLYNKFIDEVTARGSVVRDLVGSLCQVPEELSPLYGGYKGVPKTYLKIDSIREPAHPKSRSMEDLRVSVAVSFLSNYEGHPDVYASYVVFDPAKKGSLQENITWMEETYVNDFYKGIVITDFDQTTSNFSDATFSLGKVMDLKISPAELARLEKKLGYKLHDILRTQEQIIYMGKYIITGGQQGNVGDHGQIQNLTQIQNSLTDEDVVALVSELQKLRAEVKKLPDSTERDVAVGALASAEEAAKHGDKSKLLEHLKTAGKWTFDVAVKIGTTLAASVLKGVLGLP